jgi:hypothetical protein
MLFLQLTLTENATEFKAAPWVSAIKSRYPDAEVMELDNHSELYLFQKTLTWLLQSNEGLILHIHNYDPEASTGMIFRFLQDVLQKKKPLLITIQGKHAGIEKYVRAFAEYKVVASEKEAVECLGKLKYVQ